MAKEHHKILAETSGGRYTPEEVRDLEQGLIADAAAQEQEEEKPMEQPNGLMARKQA